MGGPRDDFSLFGAVATDGIPKFFRQILETPDGGERLARWIIDECRAAIGPNQGLRLHRDELRTAAQVLVEWYGKRGGPIPAFVFEANAHALSLISPDTALPLVPKDARQALRLPTGVKLPEFLQSAGRDALALVFAAAAGDSDVSAIVSRIDGGDWALSENALANAASVKRATVGGYRARTEYRDLVKGFAVWTYLGWMLRGKLARIPKRSDEELRRHVVAIPAKFILQKVGDYGDSGMAAQFTPQSLVAFQGRVNDLASRLRGWTGE